ncbi:metal-dependent hydrolase [Nocardia mexicana]|uniref:Metal-dependent hydrolase n=1 Tax=Nocardia mexicana TaxID=279262 RepID=A0A370HFJ9_9NOCA|nr:metal-dependent hydrolase [Nocardia mexicana]RDI55510.1 hypothetical protein DFR68_101343 [Nocardia mexicana]
MTAAEIKTAYPKVRRMRFRFGGPPPMSHHFVEGDIVMSHLTALLSGAFPPGEESFIRSVRRYADRITDPVLKKRVAGFIGQEAMHGHQHRALNEKLAAMGYPVVRLLTFDPDSRRQRVIVRLERMLPASVHLAGTAAAEHYTTMLALRVLTSEELQSIPMAPEVRSLLNWHALEELEHKSVAFDVYRAVGGDERTRIGVMALFYAITIPGVSVAVLLSILTDPSGWRPIAVTRQALDVYRGPLLRGLMVDLARYLRPGFHPDDLDTAELVRRWERELFGAEGTLADRVK